MRPRPKDFMNWYYLEDGAQCGPITDADFAPLTERGVITTATYLWCEGMAEWKTYGELTGVAAQSTAVAEPAGTRPSQPAVAIQSSACASPLLRIVAWLVDWFVVLTVFWLGLLALKWLLNRMVPDQYVRGVAETICVAVMGLWVIDYFTGRVSRKGATFGQSLFGMKVVTANGAQISFLRSLGRFVVLLIVNFLTFALGHITAFFDKQKRGLHDIVCGTVVLKK